MFFEYCIKLLEFNVLIVIIYIKQLSDIFVNFRSKKLDLCSFRGNVKKSEKKYYIILKLECNHTHLTKFLL